MVEADFIAVAHLIPFRSHPQIVVLSAEPNARIVQFEPGNFITAIRMVGGFSVKSECPA